MLRLKSSAKTAITTAIAVVAAIVYGVVSCYGHYFDTFGHDKSESIKTAAIAAVVLFALSYGARLLKTTRRFFLPCRILEYVFIVAFFVYFVFFGFTNFCNYVCVTSNKTSIQKGINSSIDASRNMFQNYQSYKNKREYDAKQFMDALIQNRNQNSAELDDFGFKGIPCNKLNQLREQEKNNIDNLSDNLKIDTVSAVTMLKNFRRDVNAWNLFTVMSVVDYAKVMPDSINKWNIDRTKKGSVNTMQPFERPFSGFTSTVAVPNFANLFVGNSNSSPSVVCIIIFILIGLLLLLPYITSDRDPKAEGLDWYGGYKKADYEEIL